MILYKKSIKAQTGKKTNNLKRPNFTDILRNNIQYFTGIDTMDESLYTPTKATNKNSKYYTYPNIKTHVLTHLSSDPNARYSWENFLQRSKDQTHQMSSAGLGKYKTDVGEDKKGKYISIYDTFNWDLIPGAKPYETYDRIYEKDFKEIMGDNYF